MPTSTTTICVNMPIETRQQIEELAAERQCSMSAVVKRALAAEFKKAEASKRRRKGAR